MNKPPGIDLVERARALASLIAREADEIERTRRLTEPVVSALIENGVYRVLLPQSAPALLVPQRALRTISGATYVFVIKNGFAQQRLVQAGQTEGDLIELKSGIAADEVVATSNVEQLSDGSAVRQ